MRYRIEEVHGENSIICLKCKRRSFNRGDIENRYCGFCHVFHGFGDDVGYSRLVRMVSSNKFFGVIAGMLAIAAAISLYQWWATS
jgi:hypothetical protein